MPVASYIHHSLSFTLYYVFGVDQGVVAPHPRPSCAKTQENSILAFMVYVCVEFHARAFSEKTPAALSNLVQDEPGLSPQDGWRRCHNILQ